MLKKLSIIYLLIFAFLLGYIHHAFVYNGILFNLKEGLRSVPFYMWFVWLIVSFYLTLTLHELGHFFAFLFQGIKLRALYLTVFVFYKTERSWRLTIKPRLWVLLGGLVVPDLGEIKDESQYQKVIHKFANALMAAPIVTISILVLTWISFVITIYTSSHIQWIGWMTVMTIWISLLSALYIFTFTLSNPMFYGDFVAYRKIKKDYMFQLAQIHQYTMFSTIESRETEIFLWTKAKDVLKKNTIHQTMADSAIIMAYIEGILHLDQSFDPQVDLKIQRLPIHNYVRNEHGLTLLYEVCHYYYKTERPDLAYRLFEYIQDRGQRKISDDLWIYLKKRSMHIMHIAYDEAFLMDTKHLYLGNTWIFEPILDASKMMTDAHEKLPFVPYLTQVDLQPEKEASEENIA